MMETLAELDRDLFLFLNGLHTSWLDPLMFRMTQGTLWIPFYLLLLYLVWRRYGLRRTLWILLFAALMIAAGDQLANLFKNGFQRLRPSQDPLLSGIHIVNGYKGGLYGFYSAHASNTFAVAVFLILLLKRVDPWIPWLLMPWAFILSYTRIYLGVHFPGDLLAGMAAGILLGLLFGKGFLRLERYLAPSGGPVSP